MVTQKSRFNFFFLTDMFINCLDLLSLCSSDILSICEQFSHLYVQAATQNFFITHFNLSINQFEVGQSDIKSGSHSVSHFMFSHCESVSYFMFSICQSVSQSFYVQSLSVSQSLSHFMFSHCQSVSHWFILCSVTVCQSVSHWVILCSVVVSQSFIFSICQSVSQTVSQWVILCSVAVSQSIIEWVILCSVAVIQSVS